MKQFRDLSKDEKVLIHKSFENNFFDLTSNEQRIFNDYCVGSMEEQKLSTIIKYLEKDLSKLDNLRKYENMVEKLNKDESLLIFTEIDNAALLKNLINTIRE